MKALAKVEAQEGLWAVDVPIPEIGPNDLLIKIKYTSICGTDVHIYNWDAWAAKNVPLGLVIGHEYMGVVAEVGAEVRGFKVGDRVSGEGHLTCGFCRNCRAGKRHLCRNALGVGVQRQGAFAEYLCLPAGNAFKLPDAVPDAWAAIFDPLGNAVHTALSFNLVGEDVLITGAGPIGIMAAAVCRFAGARHIVITDVNAYRLELAQAFGVDRALNVSAKVELKSVMADLGMQEGFDVGLEMSGVTAAFKQMLEAMNNGGSIALLGIPGRDVTFDINKVIFKGLTLKGIYGREIFETWYKMTSLVLGGLELSPIITHELPMTDYQKGFEVMKEGRAGKVILAW